MELGLFVILTILGALGYWRNNNMYIISISIAAFFIAAIFLAADGEVVQTKLEDSTIERRAVNGTLLETETKSGTSQDIVLSEETVMISYVYYGFASFSTLILMLRSIQLGQYGRY